MKRKGINTAIPLLLLIGLSFNFGRLFEIFAWNTNIIRTESVAQKAVSNQSSTCKYSQLNEQYWEEKNNEDSRIRFDFSERYDNLDEEANACIEKHQDKYFCYKPRLVKRPLLNVVYPDEYLF